MSTLLKFLCKYVFVERLSTWQNVHCSGHLLKKLLQTLSWNAGKMEWSTPGLVNLDYFLLDEGKQVSSCSFFRALTSNIVTGHMERNKEKKRKGKEKKHQQLKQTTRRRNINKTAMRTSVKGSRTLWRTLCRTSRTLNISENMI